MFTITAKTKRETVTITEVDPVRDGTQRFLIDGKYIEGYVETGWSTYDDSFYTDSDWKNRMHHVGATFSVSTPGGQNGGSLTINGKVRQSWDRVKFQPNYFSGDWSPAISVGAILWNSDEGDWFQSESRRYTGGLVDASGWDGITDSQREQFRVVAEAIAAVLITPEAQRSAIVEHYRAAYEREYRKVHEAEKMRDLAEGELDRVVDRLPI